jgi:hypothetical protein
MKDALTCTNVVHVKKDKRVQQLEQGLEIKLDQELIR